MKLHYWAATHGNFGDDLNLWLWDSLLPGWQGWDPSLTLVGVGTILNAAHLDADGAQRYLVVGSGQGNGPAPDFSRNAWDIRALRGPRSTRAIGAAPELAATDPAMMIGEFPEFTPAHRSARPLLVPHISSLPRHDWAAVCDQAGLEMVSPEGAAKAVIAKIAAAPLVLAESMHAAILADAFRVPWIAVSISPTFDGVKWLDWADSLGLDLTIHPLFPEIDQARRLLGRRPPERTTHAPATQAAPPPGRLPPLDPAQAPDPDAPAPPLQEAPTPRSHVPLAPRTPRLRYEGLFVAQRLRHMARTAPQLSDPARLEAARDRLRGICAQICRDYGGA